MRKTKQSTMQLPHQQRQQQQQQSYLAMPNYSMCLNKFHKKEKPACTFIGGGLVLEELVLLPPLLPCTVYRVSVPL